MADGATQFDLIVIGAGSAGLNIAGFMNRAGFRVLLIEKNEANIGGDCLNTGCVPSKALIHVARLVRDADKAAQFGVPSSRNVNMELVMRYVTKTKEVIREHENAEYLRGKGMTVIIGAARFVGKHEVEVNGERYSAKKIVIATGTIPRTTSIPGDDKVAVHTNETIFSLHTLPRNLVIVGGGPIACEIGQAFSYLGANVTLIEQGDRLLAKEDEVVSAFMRERFEKDGMQVFTNAAIAKIDQGQAFINQEGEREKRVPINTLLIAIGRQPHTDGLNLAAGGVSIDGRGFIEVNEKLQTNNKDIYALGDIIGGPQFTHAGEHQARVILGNFFSPFKKKISYDSFGWVTYTTPEVATFGKNQAQLEKARVHVEVIEKKFDDTDRGIITGGSGFLKLFVDARGYLLGGTVIAPNAGELFQELLLAAQLKIPVSKLFEKTYPYPVASRINRDAIGEYLANKKLNSVNKRLLRWLY